MVRKKARAPQPETLIAMIEGVERTYFIAENAGDRARVDDEAILDVIGRIEDISQARRRYLGQRIEMSFICARSFGRNEATPTADKTFLLSVQLRKDRCSLMAYLPADAFWALPAMISSGAVTHIAARFDKPHYGTADLLSVHFAPRSKIGGAE
jgi:hypothetical protein